MAWKWYTIETYKASVGAGAAYYGILQLRAPGFYAAVNFRKSGPLPNASAPTVGGEQRFYSSLDFRQMRVMLDILRNEEPVRFGYHEENPSTFHLMTGHESVGEGDGILAEATG